MSIGPRSARALAFYRRHRARPIGKPFFRRADSNAILTGVNKVVNRERAQFLALIARTAQADRITTRHLGVNTCYSTEKEKASTRKRETEREARTRAWRERERDGL